MKLILDALDTASFDYQHFTCRVLDVNVVVDTPVERECHDDDAADPPAGIQELIQNSPPSWPRVNAAPDLRMRLIPTENLARLKVSAHDEARRRNLLEDWRQSFPGSVRRTIAMAAAWWDVYRTNAASLADDAARAQMMALSKKLENLQDKANTIYEKYQDTLQQMVDTQKAMALLDTLSSIVGIARDAVSIGDMKDESGNVASKDATPETPHAKLMSFRMQESFQTRQGLNQRKVEVNGAFDSVEDMENQLRQQWQHYNIHNAPKSMPLERPR